MGINDFKKTEVSLMKLMLCIFEMDRKCLREYMAREASENGHLQLAPASALL